MAKKSAIAKQKRREAMVQRRFEQRKLLRQRVKDQSLTVEEREMVRDELNKLPRDSAAVRLRNRCQLTGRPRGFYRKFQICRIAFRELASQGFLPGVIKASW